MMRARVPMAISVLAAVELSACGSSATLPSIIAAAPPTPRPRAAAVAPPAADPALVPAPALALPPPPPITTTPAPAVAPAAPTAPLAPSSPPAAGVVGVSVGQALDDKDRNIAIAAQQDAVSSGQRKSWRGEHGAYGFVTPGSETGACRDYTHRIFINGRPQEAKGQACKQDGQWRVTS